MSDAIQAVRDYHQRTKHYLDGYARGPEYLDWDEQPDPFRHFAGSPVIELPLLIANDHQSVSVLDLSTIAALLELSMGLSAWKQLGPDRWSLRCNPSSGNLHPTETYIVATDIDGLDNGVYHYAPNDHVLEKRGSFPAPKTGPQLLIGLSSIMWREAWKYGERAFRYVQLDVGHAIGAFRYATKALDLRLGLLAFPDVEIARLLGLDRKSDFTGAENEHPDILMQIQLNIGQQSLQCHSPYLPKVSEWYGSASTLGGLPKYQWDIIDEVATATVCEYFEQSTRSPQALPKRLPGKSKLDKDLINRIKQRRSAQAFIGKSSALSRVEFYQMLDALLPLPEQLPWDSWALANYPDYLHLVLFVHRIEDLPTGVYILPRNIDAIDKLRAAMKTEFSWKKPDTCPEHLPLYQLVHADARKAARTLSCHQEIVSSSFFSLGMLAEFDSALAQGACVYRHLYWEAGLVGQVLYMEAEAKGVRGTGIGCFFDDSVHDLLGLKDSQFQSMYHFTVGDPKIDNRLETLPAYSHLQKERVETNQ